MFQLAGDSKALALTDSTLISTFDPATLDTLGPLVYNDTVKENPIQLSCAHPQLDPSSNGQQLINFATDMISVFQHRLQVFRMGSDNVRRVFGTVTLPFMPYIHSFVVTKSKVVMVAFPLGFEVLCVLEFNPLTDCMKWHDDQNATMFVFDLNSTSAVPPSAQVAAPGHFSMHQVNAWDESDTEIVMEAAVYEDGGILVDKYKHADLAVMKDPKQRDQVHVWADLRRWRLSLKQPVSLTFTDAVLTDQKDYSYKMDFPFINPRNKFKPHRFVWAVTPYAHNSSRYEDWALLKIDQHASSGSPSVTSFFKEGHYPSEPVFVPRPDGTDEDDGVVLSQVVDGATRTAYLLILDGRTMEWIGTASLKSGQVTPYTQHGLWFEDSSRMND